MKCSSIKPRKQSEGWNKSCTCRLTWSSGGSSADIRLAKVGLPRVAEYRHAGVHQRIKRPVLTP